MYRGGVSADSVWLQRSLSYRRRGTAETSTPALSDHPGWGRQRKVASSGHVSTAASEAYVVLVKLTVDSNSPDRGTQSRSPPRSQRTCVPRSPERLLPSRVRICVPRWGVCGGPHGRVLRWDEGGRPHARVPRLGEYGVGGPAAMSFVPTPRYCRVQHTCALGSPRLGSSTQRSVVGSRQYRGVGGPRCPVKLTVDSSSPDRGTRTWSPQSTASCPCTAESEGYVVRRSSQWIRTHQTAVH